MVLKVIPGYLLVFCSTQHHYVLNDTRELSVIAHGLLRLSGSLGLSHVRRFVSHVRIYKPYTHPILFGRLYLIVLITLLALKLYLYIGGSMSPRHRPPRPSVAGTTAERSTHVHIPLQRVHDMKRKHVLGGKLTL